MMNCEAWSFYPKMVLLRVIIGVVVLQTLVILLSTEAGAKVVVCKLEGRREYTLAQGSSWDTVDGVLQVRIDDTWRYVEYMSSYGTEIITAPIACRQMGLDGGTPSGQSFKIKEHRNANFSTVNCDNLSTNISTCNATKMTPNGNEVQFVMKVVCTARKELQGLFNVNFSGNGYYNGTLEVRRPDDGSWLPLKNDTQVANISCKQMGFSEVEEPVNTNTSSKINVVSYSCPGDAKTISGCGTGTVIQGNGMEAKCLLDKNTQTPFHIRLSPDGSTNKGTVEIKQYGQWGVICGDNWTIEKARVVCRQLGFKDAARFLKDAYYGQGNGVVLWEDVRCRGDEYNLLQCNSTKNYDGKRCYSEKAAGVECKNEKYPAYKLCDFQEVNVSNSVSVVKLESFSYTSGQNCSLLFKSNTSLAVFSVYSHYKSFQNNHVESVSFIWTNTTGNGTQASSSNATGAPPTGVTQQRVQVYGDTFSFEPFTNTSESLEVVFEAGSGSGIASLNVELKVTTITPDANGNPSPTTTQTTVPGPGLPGSTGSSGQPGNVVGAGTLAGIVIVGLLLLILAIIFVLRWKKIINFPLKRTKRSSSIHSFEDGNSVRSVGVDNKAYTKDTLQGNGTKPANGVGVTMGAYADVELDKNIYTEPETGEKKVNGWDTDDGTLPSGESAVDLSVGSAYESVPDNISKKKKKQKVEIPLTPVDPNTLYTQVKPRKAKSAEASSHKDSETYAEVNKSKKAPKPSVDGEKNVDPNSLYSEVDKAKKRPPVPARSAEFEPSVADVEDGLNPPQADPPQPRSPHRLPKLRPEDLAGQRKFGGYEDADFSPRKLPGIRPSDFELQRKPGAYADIELGNNSPIPEPDPQAYEEVKRNDALYADPSDLEVKHKKDKKKSKSKKKSKKHRKKEEAPPLPESQPPHLDGVYEDVDNKQGLSEPPAPDPHGVYQEVGRVRPNLAPADDAGDYSHLQRHRTKPTSDTSVYDRPDYI